MADVVAHMQITSCYHGTASCPEREQGLAGPNLWGGAVFRTHLDVRSTSGIVSLSRPAS